LNHNIEIRNLSDFNDVSLLKKLYDLNQANVPEVGSIETLNNFISLLKLSDDILLSYADNQMTGFVVCFYEKSYYSSLNYKYFLENYSDFLYIDRIAVSKNLRRSGIGSALYKKLIEKYKKTKSIICCEVNIKPINTISLNFHSSFNFEKVDEKDFKSHKVRYLVRKDNL
jgi:predicted GNAT superfamily acetyltransferase